MKRQRNLGIAAVAAVALAAAGAALAAGKLHNTSRPATAGSGPSAALADYANGTIGRMRFGGRHPGMDGGGHLAAAASYLGMSESDLRSALQDGKTLAQVAKATSGKSVDGLIDALVADEQKEIAQLLKDGRITQAQADRMTANAKAHVTAMVNGTAPRPGPGMGHGMGHGRGDAFQAAATYLGVSVSDLMTKLEAGKTLAQVADATSGKSASGLIDALVKAEQDELAQAVKDGRLTQAQADGISAGLKDRVTAMVNGTAPRPGPGMGHGMGMGMGPGPGGPAPAAHI